jgi:hypothetical protein
MLDIDMGYPLSEALKKLADEGEETAKLRGHRLFWSYYDLLEGKASATCAVCGRGVNVVVDPAPNDIDISGEALAVGCDSPIDAYRRKLEERARRDWPATRAEIGAYYRDHGHLLGGWWTDADGRHNNKCLRCGGALLVDAERGRVLGLSRGDCWPKSKALNDWRAMQAARDLEVTATWREDLSDVWYIFEFRDGWFVTVPDGRGPIEWGEGWIPSPRWSVRVRAEDVPDGVRRKLEKEIKRIRKIETRAGR